MFILLVIAVFFFCFGGWKALIPFFQSKFFQWSVIIFIIWWLFEWLILSNFPYNG